MNAIPIQIPRSENVLAQERVDELLDRFRSRLMGPHGWHYSRAYSLFEKLQNPFPTSSLDVWQTITIGVHKKPERYLELLLNEQNDIEVDRSTQTVIKAMGGLLATKEEAVQLVRFRAEDVGLHPEMDHQLEVEFDEMGWSTADYQIDPLRIRLSHFLTRVRAQQLGFELCPPEVALALRLFWNDQPKDSRAIVISQPLAAVVPAIKIGYKQLSDEEMEARKEISSLPFKEVVEQTDGRVPVLFELAGSGNELLKVNDDDPGKRKSCISLTIGDSIRAPWHPFGGGKEFPPQEFIMVKRTESS